MNTPKHRIAYLAAVIFATALFTGACANQVAPTGGEKDTTPPELVRAIPENGLTNFKARQIALVFDEFIQFRYPNDEFSVLPTLPGELKVKVRPKAIYLTLPDSLAPNTTYLINFGSSVKDLNEGNPIANLLYVFSTGDYLDSLELNGKVMQAITMEPAKGYTIGLWAQDADPTAEKPLYYTKTNDAGRFSQGYLRPDTFAVYAFNDKNGNGTIEPGTEELAFLDAPVYITDSNPEVVLFSSLSYPHKPRTTDRKMVADGHIRYVFNRPLNTPISILTQPDIAYQTRTDGDTLHLYFGPINDTIHITLLETDTLANHQLAPWKLKDSTFGITVRKNPGKVAWSSGSGFLLSAQLPIRETAHCSTIKLKPADTMVADTVIQVPFQYDEIGYTFSVEGIAPGKYFIEVPAGCFTDVAGRASKGLTDSIILDDPENFGELVLKIRQIPAGLPLRLFLASGQPDPRSSLPVSEQVSFTRMSPGTYTLYFFEDANKNGLWDRADFFRRLQAEKLAIYQQTITIRSGWSTEAEVDLNTMFPAH